MFDLLHSRGWAVGMEFYQALGWAGWNEEMLNVDSIVLLHVLITAPTHLWLISVADRAQKSFAHTTQPP